MENLANVILDHPIYGVRHPTPFMSFWTAVNSALRDAGHPELNYGPASQLWRKTLREANALASHPVKGVKA